MAPPLMQPTQSSAVSRCTTNQTTNSTVVQRKSGPNPSVGGRKPPSGNRSNSTLTAKEVELANWKRRKSYDPMKAAAEGKRGAKKCATLTTGSSGSGTESEVPHAAIMPTPTK